MSGEFPEEAIAQVVMDTATQFRGWLESQGDKEVTYVGVATLITDLTMGMAAHGNSMAAAQMLIHQLELLFEEFPDTKRQIMAEQVRRFMSQQRP